MPISLNPMMMRAVIMDHYENPRHKHYPKDDGYESLHSKSPNCIDDITIYAKYDNNDVVVDCCFEGIACTISTSSTDIMCELVIGKTKQEAKYIIEQYLNMIHEKEFDDSVLDEAIVFINTSKQAARIKCATIGWDALNNILDGENHAK